MTEEISRRSFAKTAGAAIGGLVIGAVGGYSLMPPKEIVVEKKVEVPQDVPEHPWVYQKLDVDKVKERAYNAYFEGGCSFGVFEGIVGELRDTYGYPFTSVPTKISVYGKGGTVGFGTLCGALNGAAMAMNLVSNDLSMVTEIVGEYTENTYPSYKPAVAKKTDADLPTSISGSPLCHISVTKWCEASGFGSGSDERKERCGRLVAEVAGRAVEILNQNADGAFTAAFVNPETVTSCNNCHFDTGIVANVLTKSECTQCHGDPHT